MTAALDALLASLDLEQIEVDIFRGSNPSDLGLRTFGGFVSGQALVAAGRTVPGAGGGQHRASAGRDGERSKRVHSLHAYFLRPGAPEVPILYQVDRIRDSRNFSTRRVAAVQGGEAIFHLSASFHAHEEGVAHQVPMPDVPDPETLPDWQGRHRAVGDMPEPRPIDVRHVGTPVRTERGSAPRAPEHAMWFRANGNLPDDPLVHACVVAHASDLTLLDTIMLPHGLIWEDPAAQQVSLDHAMWFHRPVRADDWLLSSQRSPIAADARGLATSTIFTRSGELAVTVVQEGLLRPHRPTSASGH